MSSLRTLQDASNVAVEPSPNDSAEAREAVEVPWACGGALGMAHNSYPYQWRKQSKMLVFLCHFHMSFSLQSGKQHSIYIVSYF